MSDPTGAAAKKPDRPKLASAMARRRRSILAAAVDLFQERGYLGTAVDDIAARASVTKRTLYHHMGNKENILSEIHSGLIEEGLQRWESVIEAGGPATDVLRALVAEHVKLVTTRRKEIACFFEEEKHLNEASRANIVAQRVRQEEILRTVIAEGVESGEFRSDLNVSIITLLLLGGLTEMYKWYRPSSRSARNLFESLNSAMDLNGIAI